MLFVNMCATWNKSFYLLSYLLFLFLVANWMGVLVKGGWWHSHFNRTPDRRILDDLHSPSRFCHGWAKPARRAPTNAPSLSGTLKTVQPSSWHHHPSFFCWGSRGVDLLWCVRWRRSYCFVTCSAVFSERTGYFLPAQLVVLAFDARMTWILKGVSEGP